MSHKAFYLNAPHRLPMNLQFFAEPSGDGNADAGSAAPTASNAGSQTGSDSASAGSQESAAASTSPNMVSMTNQQFEERLKRAASSAAKSAVESAAAQATEAKKLEDMTELEKANYLLKQEQDKNEQLTRSNARIELSQTATTILAGKGIAADEDVLNFVVRDTAEDTNKAIEAFSALIDEKAEVKAQEKLRGKVPGKRPVGQENTPKDSFGAQLAKKTNESRGTGVADDFFGTNK